MKKLVLFSAMTALVNFSSVSAFGAAAIGIYAVAGTGGLISSQSSACAVANECDPIQLKIEVAQAARMDALSFLSGGAKSAAIEGMIANFRRNNPNLQISDEALAAQIVAESNEILN